MLLLCFFITPHQIIYIVRDITQNQLNDSRKSVVEFIAVISTPLFYANSSANAILVLTTNVKAKRFFQTLTDNQNSDHKWFGFLNNHNRSSTDFNWVIGVLTNLRSRHSWVFLTKFVLKICSKFTGEHPCRSVISIKFQSNFIEIILRHRCSPVNLLDICRTPTLKNMSEGLLL